MLRSLNSGVSAMQRFQESMDVIGNNVANVNTTAFKSARVDFADSLSQTFQASAAGRNGASNTPSMQVGTGLTTTAIQNDFTQGSIGRTNLKTDLTISGNGFFTVRDTITNSQYVTRAGNFKLDEAGRLVTQGGMRVQGYSDSGLTTLGDITIDPAGAPLTAQPGATVDTFKIDGQGLINVRLSDGTEFVRGQILLQDFRDPQGLMKYGGSLYTRMNAAGATGAAGAPASGSLGRIEAGALELSNVDLAEEFADLIKTQRAFQASARIISTGDEVLQELVNLKR